MRHPLTAASAALVVTGSVLLLVGYNAGTPPDQADPPAASPAAETRPPGSPGSTPRGRTPAAASPMAHATPLGPSRPLGSPTALAQNQLPPMTAQPLPATSPSAAPTHPAPTHPATPHPATPHPATPHPATPQPAASPSRLGTPGPDRVAVAAITALRTGDTTRDHSPRDAAARALPLLGGQLAKDVAAAGPPPGSGADWARWAVHGAHTVVTATPGADSGAPPDTAAVVYRQYTVTVTAVGRDHWQGSALTYVVFATVTRGPAGWRVTALAESATAR